MSGAPQSFSRQPWLLKVTTPHLQGDIDGTEFYVQAEDDRSLLIVLEGRVLVSNDKGRLTVASGQAATAEAGKAPVYHIVVRPRDAVQWALYYPPILYLRPDEFPPGPGWQGMVRQSIELYPIVARAKVNPRPWKWVKAHEIGCCYPVGEGR
ncbi:MAG: hypothetical protein ACREXK_13550 [Gammaproteobacteria bacterium]